MPLHEYQCQRCLHQFEVLLRATTVPSCPACHSDVLNRLVSLFGVSTDATRKSAVRQARKLGEKSRRDAAVAEQERINHHHD
jgi:putative FmdB family regulatory protein